MRKKGKVLALIPARLNSKRLPKKVLLSIANLPLIIHVYRRVLFSKKIDDAYICCDDKAIFDCAKKFGAKVILISGILTYLLAIGCALVGNTFWWYFSSLVLMGLGWNFLFI